MDRYSRSVAFLKVVLPLAALVLLSTLFLLSRGIDQNATMPFSDAEIAERIRDQQITAPRFVGTTERGDEVLLYATKAVAGGAGKPGEAKDLRGEMRLAAGGVVTLHADRGRLNLPRDRAEFEGAVRITTDTGYDLVTDVLVSAVRSVEVSAPGPVSGTGPLGELRAGAMQLTARDGDAGKLHLVFTGGVKLLYQPPDSKR